MASTLAVVTPATHTNVLDVESKPDLADDGKVEATDDASSVVAQSAAEAEPSELRAWLVVLGTFASNAATVRCRLAAESDPHADGSASALL